MRVGILTMSLGENMGGVLQAYALYKLIEEAGHEPILIRHAPPGCLPRAKRILRCLMEYNPLSWIYDPNRLRLRHRNSKPLKKFVGRAFIRKTETVMSQADFVRMGNQMDAIVVGSDQVWRYLYSSPEIEWYFLEGLSPQVRKIAYAASFGIGEWECKDPELTKKLSNLLKQFAYVSVREQSGLEILSQAFDYCDGEVCLDPTLLQDKEFYNSIIDESGEDSLFGRRSQEKYLFAYILDLTEEKKAEVERYAEGKGLKVRFASIPIHLPSLSPAEWLASVRGAEEVVTDSFHGSVFSLIYGRPLCCLGNSSRGTERFCSLFRLYGIDYKATDCGCDTWQTITPNPDIAQSLLREKNRCRNALLGVLIP